MDRVCVSVSAWVLLPRCCTGDPLDSKVMEINLLLNLKVLYKLFSRYEIVVVSVDGLFQLAGVF